MSDLPPDTTNLRSDGACTVCEHHWTHHRSVGASEPGRPVGYCLEGRWDFDGSQSIDPGERCSCAMGWRLGVNA